MAALAKQNMKKNENWMYYGDSPHFDNQI